jgi:hypothetical protein
MYHRIFENWKSTSLAVGLITVSLLYVYLGKAELNDVGVFMGGALILIFSKDDTKAN